MAPRLKQSRQRQIPLISLGFLLLSRAAYAADTAAILAGGKDGSVSETTTLFLAICKVVGSLAIVIALIVCLIYILKKIGLKQSFHDTSLIKVLDNKMIAPKKYIAIVEIAGKTVSVGVTDNNINLLTELDDEATKLAHESSPQSSANKLPKQFTSFLAKAAGKNSQANIKK